MHTTVLSVSPSSAGLSSGPSGVEPWQPLSQPAWYVARTVLPSGGEKWSSFARKKIISLNKLVAAVGMNCVWFEIGGVDDFLSAEVQPRQHPVTNWLMHAARGRDGRHETPSPSWRSTSVAPKLRCLLYLPLPFVRSISATCEKFTRELLHAFGRFQLRVDKWQVIGRGVIETYNYTTLRNMTWSLQNPLSEWTWLWWIFRSQPH